MLVELPLLWTALINVFGIPLAHLLIAWGSLRLPQTLFRFGANRKRQPPNLDLYEKLFFIRKWKHLLPDAAPWFKGFAKGSLQSRESEYLKTFIAETKRGEFSHWLQLIVIACFASINPWWAQVVIVLYAALSNLPCILNLRYTRIRISKVLKKGNR